MIHLRRALPPLTLPFALLIATTAAHANSARDCERPLLHEDKVAGVFPGLDRTFFRLFDWTYDPHPIIRVKFDGVPTNPRAAAVLEVGLTRRDPRLFAFAQPEFYQSSLRVRTGDRALQTRLMQIVEQREELSRIALEFYPYRVSNTFVRDGDLLIMFGEGPLAKHVASGINVTLVLYQALARGADVAEAIEALAQPLAIAPPPIALPPPPGAKVH